MREIKCLAEAVFLSQLRGMMWGGDDKTNSISMISDGGSTYNHGKGPSPTGGMFLVMEEMMGSVQMAMNRWWWHIRDEGYEARTSRLVQHWQCSHQGQPGQPRWQVRSSQVDGRPRDGRLGDGNKGGGTGDYEGSVYDEGGCDDSGEENIAIV
jgi:hypothetical protein